MIKRNGKKPLGTFCFLFFLSASLYSQNTFAGFTLDRIRLTLSPAAPVQAIRVTADKENSEALVQVNAVTWTQKDGVDNYQPTKDLILSPPFLKITPGTTQILRIGLRKPVQASDEQAYRVSIHEITPHSNKPGIEFRVNASVPIFVPPANPVPSAVLTLKRTDAQNYSFGVKNTGNVHLQVISITLTDENKKSENITGASYYVLPQQAREHAIKISSLSGNQFRVVVNTDSGPITQTVTLSP